MLRIVNMPKILDKTKIKRETTTQWLSLPHSRERKLGLLLQQSFAPAKKKTKTISKSSSSAKSKEGDNISFHRKLFNDSISF